MKWPFVRRSKYENAMIYGINTAKEITEKTSYIHKLEDQIEIYKKIHDEYAQLNRDNLVEINRLNQELASELNSHRETKKNSDKLIEILRNDISTQQGMYEILELKNEELEVELEETKDALKIAQEDNKKLHKVNNECWDAAIIFVDSINLARTGFMKDK